jgi:hypothetical protein
MREGIVVDVVEQLKARTPKGLQNFRASIDNVALPDTWSAGLLFVTKAIRCTCGAIDLQLKTLQRTETKGLFKKRVVVTHAAPIHLSCPACSRSALLFDPAIHGWNGQEPGSSPSPVDEASLTLAPERGNVFVNYSYQSPEEYAELVAEGVGNAEDYFDTFTVYFRPAGEQGLVQVASYECA